VLTLVEQRHDRAKRAITGFESQLAVAIGEKMRILETETHTAFRTSCVKKEERMRLETGLLEV
jgi:hypothetical protein